MSTAPGSRISLTLQGVILSVQVGAHPWEKFPQRPTRLRVDLELEFDYHSYFKANGGYVDYDPLRMFLKDLETRPHVDTLEEMARDMLSACFKLTDAERVRLKLAKPDIFNEMEGVGLAYDVWRGDFEK